LVFVLSFLAAVAYFQYRDDQQAKEAAKIGAPLN